MTIHVNASKVIDPELAKRLNELVGGRPYIIIVEAGAGRVRLREFFTNTRTQADAFCMLTHCAASVLQLMHEETHALRAIAEMGTELGRALLAKWPRS